MGKMIMDKATYTSVSAVARRLGVTPTMISNLFYRRILSDEICPVIDGRRLIPSHYVLEIERLLIERGLLEEKNKGTGQ
jgi:DNA-binding transcriptional regulator YdaS (Cro superfamily)